jgi:hypothetical protein
VFGDYEKPTDAAQAVAVTVLHAKTGRLTLENDFLERARQGGSVTERNAMIDRDHDLPVLRQADLP